MGIKFDEDGNENFLATVTTEDLVTVLDTDLINIACDESRWVGDIGAASHVTSRKDVSLPILLEGYVSTNGDGKWKLIKGSLIVACGNKRCGMYWTTTSTCIDMVNTDESDSSSMLWHKRLSHISEKVLNVLDKKKLLSDFQSAK
ncbi:hypothetical protein KY289_025218 [Solanum tuberosum]|nr:hypothetical protein KY289_025218 [Solanum tuberosum]